MVRVSDGEFQQQWSDLRRIATVEPVTITSNGRDSMVLISANEYKRLKQRDRQVMTLADFTEKDLTDLRRMEAPVEAAAFDHEVKD